MSNFNKYRLSLGTTSSNKLGSTCTNFGLLKRSPLKVPRTALDIAKVKAALFNPIAEIKKISNFKKLKQHPSKTLYF